MTRRSYKQYTKDLKTALSKLNDYSEHARRGYIVAFLDETGLVYQGTKNMVDKFKQSGLPFWFNAGNLDTLCLNSEDETEVQSVKPTPIDKNNVASLYQNTDLPRLPLPLAQCNGKELRKWVAPQIIKDVAERSGVKMRQVDWGKESSKPSFWPDMVEWAFFTNPSHGQKYAEKFTKYKAVDVLRECAAIRIRSKGLDPFTYHSESHNEAIVQNRIKNSKGKSTCRIQGNYHGLSWTIMDYHGLSWTIMDYHGL